jgi:Kef-type K+ transport system membrane component KefB
MANFVDPLHDLQGVHPIFGAFLVGLIIPHQHGFARKTTEKLDDLVSLIFLPIVSLAFSH